MANSQTHFRSISLPTRLPSNTPISFKSQVKKLKSLQNVNNNTVVGSSSQDIQSGLVELANIYTSLQQQELINHFSGSENSLFLDGSVDLIDSCNSIREMFHAIQENVQSLQSAIRRKGIESIQDEVSAYLCFRKKMNKNLSRSLKSLKNLENTALLVSAESDNLEMALRDAIVTFRSILMYLSCPVAKSGSWNLISRLMVTKAEASGKDHCVASEVERLDCALAAKVLDGLTVQSCLQELDSCIDGIESGLETVYKEMIRCRVKILNILADY